MSDELAMPPNSPDRDWPYFVMTFEAVRGLGDVRILVDEPGAPVRIYIADEAPLVFSPGMARTIGHALAEAGKSSSIAGENRKRRPRQDVAQAWRGHAGETAPSTAGAPLPPRGEHTRLPRPSPASEAAANGEHLPPPPHPNPLAQAGARGEHTRLPRPNPLPQAGEGAEAQAAEVRP